MQIFISYAHENKDWYDRLYRTIERAARKAAGDGVQIFSDVEIGPGQRWDSTLRSHIQAADLVILLGSAAFVNSSYIDKTELPLILAKDNEASLFPILLTSVGKDPELRAIQWKPQGGLAQYLDTPEYDEQLLAVQEDLLHRLRSIFESRSGFSAVDKSGGTNLCSEDLLLGMKDIAASPLVRITIEALGPDVYRAELEARLDREPFTLQTCEFAVADACRNIPPRLFDGFGELTRFVDAARERCVPIRIQLVFHRNAQQLDQVDWETVRWMGAQLGASPSFVFSRQFAFPEADYGDLQIKPIHRIDYLDLSLEVDPPVVDANVAWVRSRPLFRSPELSPKFRSLKWNQEFPIRAEDVRECLRESEVAYLGVRVGIPRSGVSDLRLLLPAADAYTPTVCSISSLCSMIESLKEEQPTLIILGPRATHNTEINKELASRLATARVPAIVAPIGNVVGEAWDAILNQLIDDLHRHGVIDLAVSAARVRARKFGFSVLLYLRSRSARLWYRPTFVLKSGANVNDREVWDTLKASVSAPVPCIALIGPNLERTLSLSRRDMAKTMARRFGFALSKKDREDLETVAEFIHVSEPKTAEGLPPHVSAFTQTARSCLLQLLPHAMRREFETRSLRDITNKLARIRDLGPDDAFSRLARLKMANYITAYYHEILELELTKAGRRAASRSFFRPDAASGAPRTLHEPSVEHPSVYHCFGSFSDESNLLLSKTDYLDFFATYCRPATDPQTEQIRSLISSSPLLVLGFRPNSSDLKMLLAVHRKIDGRALSKMRPHVAVQIDPEDDHTIDPEGARTFYRGLLSELGEKVYIYWGTPQKFLAEFETNCPDAFYGSGSDVNT